MRKKRDRERRRGSKRERKKERETEKRKETDRQEGQTNKVGIMIAVKKKEYGKKKHTICLNSTKEGKAREKKANYALKSNKKSN